MGFELVAPQVVRHSDGFTVQIGGRYHIEYLEAERAAEVTADLDGPLVRLHAKTVRWTRPHARPPTELERRLILDRTRAGMEAMGAACQLLEE
jgi:hypothetical protein